MSPDEYNRGNLSGKIEVYLWFQKDQTNIKY